MQKMACACFILGCRGVKKRGIARRKFGGVHGRCRVILDIIYILYYLYISPREVLLCAKMRKCEN